MTEWQENQWLQSQKVRSPNYQINSFVLLFYRNQNFLLEFTENFLFTYSGKFTIIPYTITNILTYHFHQSFALVFDVLNHFDTMTSFVFFALNITSPRKILTAHGDWCVSEPIHIFALRKNSIGDILTKVCGIGLRTVECNERLCFRPCTCV